MRTFIAAALVTLSLAACKTRKPFASVTPALHSYEVIADTETRVLKGIISRADLESDTAHFSWFTKNRQYGQADADAVKAFQKNGSKFQVVVFGGTWCHDTQNLLPQFYRLVDLSGYSNNNITLIAVDRTKTTTGNLHTAFHITNVPTFIVLKDGKEVGRIVEYGKYGQIDKELGEIVNGL